MIVINKHKLPETLEKLILNKQWEASLYFENLKKIPSLQDIVYLQFLSVDSMKKNTLRLKDDYLEGDGELFGLVAINDFIEKQEKGYLPFESIVIIAASPGDDSICLFYDSKGDIKVYASDWSTNKCRWVMIANSFDCFYKKFKI